MCPSVCLTLCLFAIVSAVMSVGVFLFCVCPKLAVMFHEQIENLTKVVTSQIVQQIANVEQNPQEHVIPELPTHTHNMHN